MDPDPESSQLHGDWVQVDPVDATAGDLTAQQAGVLDLNTLAEWAERVVGSRAQPVEFGGYLRNRAEREEAGQPRLYAIDCGDEEVA